MRREFWTGGFRTSSPKEVNSINEKLALRKKRVCWNRNSRKVLWAMVLHLWLTPISSHWHTFYGTRTTFAGSPTFCRWSNSLKQIPRGPTTCEITASGINYSIQTKQGLRDNLSFKREEFKEIIPKEANSIIWKKRLKKRVVYRSKNLQIIVNHCDLLKTELYKILTDASAGNRLYIGILFAKISSHLREILLVEEKSTLTSRAWSRSSLLLIDKTPSRIERRKDFSIDLWSDVKVRRRIPFMKKKVNSTTPIKDITYYYVHCYLQCAMSCWCLLFPTSAGGLNWRRAQKELFNE